MKNYILNDIVSFQNGYAFDSTLMGQYGTNIIKIKEIKNNRITITDSTQKIAKCDKSIMHKYKINYNDILIALTGDPINKGSAESWVGRAAIYRESDSALLNQRLCKIIPNTEYILNKYLYYFLISFPTLYKLASSAKGSANQANISHKDVGNLVINLPSLKMQQHIVDTVGSLDDKIENNNKIIESLIKWKANNYQKTLNKTSCCETDLLNIVNFIGGTQPPKSEHIYNYEKGYVRFIQNRDYSSENHLTFIKISSKNKLCNEYDIMMDKYGEAGKVRFGINGAYNVALAKIEPKKENYQEWIREFLNTNEIQRYLYNSSIASTRASVSENNLMNIKIPLPNENVVCNFEKRHKTILKMILNLKTENKYLQDLKKLYLDYYFN